MRIKRHTAILTIMLCLLTYSVAHSFEMGPPIVGSTFDIFTDNKIDSVYLGVEVIRVAQFNHVMYFIFMHNGTEVWIPDSRIIKMYRTGGGL